MVQAKRPLLVIPASLKEDTKVKFRALSRHWQGPHPDAYRVLSYELLGRKQSGVGTDGTPGVLELYAPDLIVLDEAHYASNSSAACTKRLGRFIRANPQIPVVAMSGTMTSKSLKEYAHLAHWCLKDLCPCPVRHTDLQNWAAALDDRVQERLDPGALRMLLSAGDLEIDDPLEQVRVAYRRRVIQTPGVVATQDGAISTALSLLPLDPGEGDPKVEATFETLRTLWETPDGHPLADGIQLWRHARELALGFFYRWDPRPPEEWLNRRKEWASWCRLAIKHNRRGFDSESQIKDAVKAGVYDDGGLLARWEEIAPTFEPNSVPVWHSDEALNHAHAWLLEYQGIVWVEHTAFGNELSRRTGIPYYAQGGYCGNTHITEASGPIIASIASSGTGRNLQAWKDNLIMSLPQSAKRCEQLLARTHRPGQMAPEVRTWVWIGGWEHLAGAYIAREGAKYQRASLGSDQRLLYCYWGLPEVGEIERRKGYRWDRNA
jgi:hypothetical protein